MLVMFFLFFSTPNLRAPSANHRETSPHDRCLCLFYKLTTKIRGALPLTKLGAKNMQNFGRFHTTSDFDREYLRNAALTSYRQVQQLLTFPSVLSAIRHP